MHAVPPGADIDSGYRFFAVECPEGFSQNLHADQRGVVCYRQSDLPHPVLVMTVSVLNLQAADGWTRQDGGMRGGAMFGVVTRAPWFLYGVRP